MFQTLKGLFQKYLDRKTTKRCFDCEKIGYFKQNCRKIDKHLKNRHNWVHHLQHGNRRDGYRGNGQVFSVKFLKTFEDNVKHLRPAKKPPCVPKPTTEETNYDKEKPQKTKSKGIGPRSRKQCQEMYFLIQK